MASLRRVPTFAEAPQQGLDFRPQLAPLRSIRRLHPLQGTTELQDQVGRREFRRHVTKGFTRLTFHGIAQHGGLGHTFRHDKTKPDAAACRAIARSSNIQQVMQIEAFAPDHASPLENGGVFARHMQPELRGKFVLQTARR